MVKCPDYELKGYCLLGPSCTREHGDNSEDCTPIQLDISDYRALVEAKQRALVKFVAQTKEEQNELKRKQADLLSNLISQQRLLIEKIELCQDEGEKSRLKVALDEMTQKTTKWMEAENERSKRDMIAVRGGQPDAPLSSASSSSSAAAATAATKR